VWKYGFIDWQVILLVKRWYFILSYTFCCRSSFLFVGYLGGTDFLEIAVIVNLIYETSFIILLMLVVSCK